MQTQADDVDNRAGVVAEPVPSSVPAASVPSPVQEVAAGNASTLANEKKGVAVPPSGPPKSFGKLKTTVKIPSSLKNVREMVTEKAVADKKESSDSKKEQTEFEANLPDQPFSPEQFLSAWEKLARQVKAEGRQGEYIVLKETPELDENHLVKVRLTNSVELDFFEKAKPGALKFLRKELQNRQIKLEHVIVKEEEGKRLYTAHEKFGYLLKKYPQLQVLKEKLGLEADF